MRLMFSKFLKFWPIVQMKSVVFYTFWLKNDLKFGRRTKKMPAVCRVLKTENGACPQISCAQEGSYFVVRLPEGLSIVDTDELCRAKGCRQPATKGVYKERLTLCEGHAREARFKQSIRTAAYLQKNVKGLCASANCQNPRVPSKKNPSALGRLCEEHSHKANARVKRRYRERMSPQASLQVSPEASLAVSPEACPTANTVSDVI